MNNKCSNFFASRITIPLTCIAILLCAILGTTPILSVQQAWAASSEGTLQGSVRSFGDLALIGGASVLCKNEKQQFSTLATADGAYILSLPAGLYICAAGDVSSVGRSTVGLPQSPLWKKVSKSVKVIIQAGVRSNIAFWICRDACPGVTSVPQLQSFGAYRSVADSPASSDANPLLSHPNAKISLQATNYPYQGNVGTFTAPGNVVMGSPSSTAIKAYFIWWLPPGYCSLNCDTSEQGKDTTYKDVLYDFGDVGYQYSPPNQPSAYQDILAQYGVNIHETEGLGWVDTHAYPHKGTQADPLTAKDIEDEIHYARRVNNWPYSSTPTDPTIRTVFHLFTASGVESCALASAPNCSFATGDGSYYCAFHSFTIETVPPITAKPSANSLVYTYMPGAKSAGSPTSDASDSPRSCGTPTDTAFVGSSTVIHNKALAAEVDTFSHESAEMQTDPLLNAWYDRDGYEVGDKCQAQYPTLDANGADITMFGISFIIQEEWSNTSNQCQLTWW